MFSRIVVLMSLVGLWGCGNPERTLDNELKSILNEYTAQTGFVQPRFVDLAELVPEDWDSVHLVGRQANPFDVVDDRGFQLSNWGLAFGTEFFAQAFFVKDGRVIRHSRLSILQIRGTFTLPRASARLELILSLVRPSRYVPNAQEGLHAHWHAPIDARELYCSSCVMMSRLQSRCSAEPFLNPHGDADPNASLRRTCDITRNYELPIITPVMSFAHFKRNTASYSMHNCYHPTKVHSTSYGVGVDAWGDAIKPDGSRSPDLLLASGEVRSNGWARFTVKFDARGVDVQSTRLRILIDPTGPMAASGNGENDSSFDSTYEVHVDPAAREGALLIRGDKPKVWVKNGLRNLSDGFVVSVPTRLFKSALSSFRFKVSLEHHGGPSVDSTVHDHIPEVQAVAISVSPQTRFNAHCAPEEPVEE